MSDREPIETTNLDTLYGSREIPWSRPHDLLAATPFSEGTSFFLATVRPDGRPHSAAIGAAWYEGDLYFQCGPETRKARNIAANPACTLSASLPGIDLVVEGEARRVADEQTLEAIADVYRESGWPVQVDGDAFTAEYSAPSAGPPPWHLFRVTAHTVFGVATAEPYGGMRWRF